MRPVVVAANWKMHKTRQELVGYFDAFWPLLPKRPDNIRVVFAVPSPFLEAAVHLSRERGVEIFSQNVFYEPQGAFTGEISVAMLKSIAVTGAVVGHSERRQYFGETSEIVALKVAALLEQDLQPILCIGETKEQREQGKTQDVLRQQLAAVFSKVPNLKNTIIAYEPVWAIGTGRTATKEQAQEAHAFIRGLIASEQGRGQADKTPILYGGSVKPDNFADLIAQPDIDGGLVGGASLKPEDFGSLVGSAAQLINR